jgi:polyphosphate kinase
VLSPILDKDVAQEFKEILEIQLNDNVKARIQDADEKNEYVKRTNGEQPVRSQYEIYNYLKEKHSK